MADLTAKLKVPKPTSMQDHKTVTLGGALDIFDAALGGFPEVSLASLSGNVDLTTDQARNAVLILKDAPGGAVTVRIPDDTGALASIIFVNKCTGANARVTIKSQGANTGNVAGVTLGAGKTRIIRQDEESAYPVTPEHQTGASVAQATHVWKSANQSIGSGAFAPVSFDTVVRNDGGLWSAGQPTRLTCPEAGWYEFGGGVEWAANATGRRLLGVRKNAATHLRIVSENSNSGTYETRMVVGVTDYFAAGDYVELTLYHDVGISLNAISQDYSLHFVGQLLPRL
jgi:hypothetical protein